VHRLKLNLPKGHLDGVIAAGRELVKEVKPLEDIVGLLEGSFEKGEIPGKVVSKIASMRHQLNLLRRSRHCILERLQNMKNH
jgi:hypothetical protein